MSDKIKAAADAALDWFDKYGAHEGSIPYGGDAVADGLRVALGEAAARPVTQDEVYHRPECLFHYCPYEASCKGADKCFSPAERKS